MLQASLVGDVLQGLLHGTPDSVWRIGRERDIQRVDRGRYRV
jgi:hypothetical protein